MGGKSIGRAAGARQRRKDGAGVDLLFLPPEGSQGRGSCGYKYGSSFQIRSEGGDKTHAHQAEV